MPNQRPQWQGDIKVPSKLNENLEVIMDPRTPAACAVFLCRH